MIKSRLAITVALVGGSIATYAPGQSIVPDASALRHEYVPNVVFMRFAESTTTMQRTAILEEVGGTVRRQWDLVPGLVSVDTTAPVKDVLKQLGTRSDVLLYVEPVYVVHALETPNDPYYGELYGMERIMGPDAWDDHTGDQEFIVAVIDTGIDYNHPDLVANIWTNPGEIPGNGQDDDGNGYVDDVHGYDFSNYDSDPMDGNSHGTHCSGTIGGVGDNGVGVAGVNWRCRLAAVQFLNSGGSGSMEGAIDAVQYCNANNFRVSNNSWGGGGYSQSMFDVINAAGSQDGHIFCAAAGNSGSYGALYPAAYTCPNILSVCATDSNDNLASFSQYHPVEVDLGAPGVDILSSVPGNGYDYFSGTSMATPHVAGGTALVYSLIGGNDYAKVRNIILSTVRPLGSLAGNCATGGILNVDEAIGQTFLGPQIEILSQIPDEVDPGAGLHVNLRIDPREDTLVAGSAVVHYRSDGGGWSTSSLTNDSPMNWSTDLPNTACGDNPEFYFEVEGDIAGSVTNPSTGSANPYDLLVGGTLTAYDNNCQSVDGWSATSDAADGQWGIGVPINCGRGDPTSDYDGSGSCWLTDNSSSDGCNSDVDNGTVTLTSSAIQIGDIDDPVLSYARWFSNDYGADPYTDSFIVRISTNGSTWSTLEIVGPSSGDVSGGWNVASFALEDHIGNANSFYLQFSTSDGATTGSVVEAGVDAIMVSATDCVDTAPGDVTGDGIVNVEDILAIIAVWGSNDAAADINDDGIVDVSDLLIVIANWG